MLHIPSVQELLLIPSVKRETFKAHDENKVVAPEYTTNRPLVLQRDNFTCRGCSFSVRPDKHFDSSVSQASVEYSKYLTIHNINDDHNDYRLENLVTLCPFCHLVFHAGCVGHKSEVKVIFYPWLSQAELNLVVNLLVSCQTNPESEFYESAKMLLEHFDTHFIYADSKKLFEQGMSDATSLASALMSLFYKNPGAYKRRGELLAGLRFFPIEGAFDKAATIWVNEWLNDAEWRRIGELWEEQGS